MLMLDLASLFVPLLAATTKLPTKQPITQTPILIGYAVPFSKP